MERSTQGGVFHDFLSRDSSSLGLSPVRFLLFRVSLMNSWTGQAHWGQASVDPENSHRLTTLSNSGFTASIRWINSSPKIKAFASAVWVQSRILSDSNLKFKGTAHAPVYSTPKYRGSHSMELVMSWTTLSPFWMPFLLRELANLQEVL